MDDAASLQAILRSTGNSCQDDSAFKIQYDDYILLNIGLHCILIMATYQSKDIANSSCITNYQRLSRQTFRTL